MCTIVVSGKGTEVTPALKEHVEKSMLDAVSVFDISPMTCEVVLRHGKGRPEKQKNTCEVVLRVPKYVVRVSEVGEDMYAAIDSAASKVSRQLRKYKTRVVDKTRRTSRKRKGLIKGTPDSIFEDTIFEDTSMYNDVYADASDELVREKEVELVPMTTEEALVQIDLMGHDFYMFEDSRTGLVCVVYKRNDGGYGVIRPSLYER